jgi:hypothetical protein
MILALTQLGIHRPITVLTLIFLSSVLTVAYTTCNLTFKTDRSDLIDPQADYHRRWLQYADSFGTSSDMVVVVESTAPTTPARTPNSLNLKTADKSAVAPASTSTANNAQVVNPSPSNPVVIDAIEEMARRMRQEPELFGNILYKVETKQLREKGLYYLSPSQLQEALNLLQGFTPVLRGNWDLVSVPYISQRLSQTLGVLRDTSASQPLWNQALLLSRSLDAWSHGQGQFVNPWPEMIKVDEQMKRDDQGVEYFLNEDKSMGFIQVTPMAKEKFEGAKPTIQRIRQITKEVELLIPGIRIGVTGIPILESDEMTQTVRDMSWESVVSFICVALILIVGFRGFQYPLMATLMLGVGMAWSFAFTTAVIGHLNILSVSFATILIGLGNDFAVHYLVKYLELRHLKMTLKKALEYASNSVGIGILTSAVSTALAFYCATMTDFLAIAELGVIAAGGIMLCVLANFIMTPAMVALADRNNKTTTLPPPIPLSGWRKTLANYPFAVMSVSSILIIALCLPGWKIGPQGVVPQIHYDSNLLHMQAKNVESVKVQDRIYEKSNGSLLYAVSIAKSPQEAVELKKKFESLPTVYRVEELATQMPLAPASETTLYVQGFNALLKHLPETIPQAAPLNPQQLGKSIEELLEVSKNSSHPLSGEITQNLDRFLTQFESLELQDQIRIITEYQMRLKWSLLMQLNMIKSAASPDPVTIKDLPQELTTRFVSNKGEWLLQIFPREQIWDDAPLANFVKDLRTVDPEVTGTPLQNYEASRQILESYILSALYSLMTIVLTLLANFMHNNNVFRIFTPAVLVTGLLMILFHGSAHPIHLGTALTMIFSIVLIAAMFVDRASIYESVLALFPPVIGLLMTMGIMVLWQMDFNPANMIVLPLVLGIGVDTGVHIIHHFRTHSRNYEISESTTNGAIMTSLTTIVGFACMIPSAHQGLSSLGIVLSVGISCSLFVSMVPLPAILTMISRANSAKSATQYSFSTKQHAA